MQAWGVPRHAHRTAAQFCLLIGRHHDGICLPSLRPLLCPFHSGLWTSFGFSFFLIPKYPQMTQESALRRLSLNKTKMAEAGRADPTHSFAHSPTCTHLLTQPLTHSSKQAFTHSVLLSAY